MKKEENRFPFSMYYLSGDDKLIKARTNESSMEIIEIISGTVKMQVGTEGLYAEAGDFVYVPPGLVLSVNAEVEGTAVRGMIFDASIIEENMENFDTEVFYMFHLQSKNKVNLFKKDHAVYSVLRRYMQDSYDEYAAKDVCYKLPIRANIYLMMSSLLRFYCGSKDESDRMIYHNVLRLREVIEYISEHYCEKIYIEKLSDMITVSPDYFTKMFKDSIGKTPIEYINGLRVNEAMRRLSETEESMAEIADSIGFCNPNYFHKIFKQYINVSPLAYRKSTR